MAILAALRLPNELLKRANACYSAGYHAVIVLMGCTPSDGDILQLEGLIGYFQESPFQKCQVLNVDFDYAPPSDSDDDDNVIGFQHPPDFDIAAFLAKLPSHMRKTRFVENILRNKNHCSEKCFFPVPKYINSKIGTFQNAVDSVSRGLGVPPTVHEMGGGLMQSNKSMFKALEIGLAQMHDIPSVVVTNCIDNAQELLHKIRAMLVLAGGNVDYLIYSMGIFDTTSGTSHFKTCHGDLMKFFRIQALRKAGCIVVPCVDRHLKHLMNALVEVCIFFPPSFQWFCFC